jgi:hypothetical protein
MQGFDLNDKVMKQMVDGNDRTEEPQDAQKTDIADERVDNDYRQL